MHKISKWSLILLGTMIGLFISMGMTGEISAYQAVLDIIRILLLFGMGYAFAKWENEK